MRTFALAAVLALLVLGGNPPASHAQTCLSTSPLYGIAPGDEGAKSDWYFAGVAGPVGNGYTGTVYVSVFNSSVNQSISGTVDEFQEVNGSTQLNIFGQSFTLGPNRSQTFAFNGAAPNGDPIAVPKGKVHFHVYGAVVNVYSEQWLAC